MRPILIVTTIFLFQLSACGQTFQTKVDSFIKKYSTDFGISKENLNGTGQQFDFEGKTNPIWKRNITFKSKTSFVNNNKQTVYQRLFLEFYEYETDKQCTAALDSLLNCFGGLCDKLKWGASGQSAKITPCIYLVNAKEIIVCHINCEHQNDFWTKFKHKLETTFGNGTSRIIETGCGGPIKFKN